jgi:fatty acid desaturase
MAMGQAATRPEDADSWGEFHARLEAEMADPGGQLMPLWWTVGVLAFVTGLMSWGYAFEPGDWWLWPCGLAALAVAGTLAARAITRAERRRDRMAELNQMWDAWLDHSQGRRSTW